tara:strand:- start:1361 stop:2194 length:834 start_codon:yes stop_codon:yes gene_type:complete
MNNPKSKNDFTTGYLESAGSSYDKQRLVLLGKSNFAHCPPQYRDGATEGRFDELLLRNAYKIGIRFFYHLEQFKRDSPHVEKSVTFAEQGVGYIEKEDDKLFFCRENSCYSGRDAFSLTYNTIGVPPEHISGDDPLIIHSIAPKNYIHALATPHSIIASIDSFTPTPVELEENSLLGRKDNRVQSIDKDELREILTDEAIIDSVKKTQSQLALSSRRVNLTRKNSVLSAPIIRAYPPYKDNQKPKAQKGSIIYNETTDCLEYFTGTQWRIIKSELSD